MHVLMLIGSILAIVSCGVAGIGTWIVRGQAEDTAAFLGDDANGFLIWLGNSYGWIVLAVSIVSLIYIIFFIARQTTGYAHWFTKVPAIIMGFLFQIEVAIYGFFIGSVLCFGGTISQGMGELRETLVNAMMLPSSANAFIYVLGGSLIAMGAGAFFMFLGGFKA